MWSCPAPSPIVWQSAASRNIRLLWQHDPAEPIGRWLSIAEDRRGLRVRGKLNLAVERAREIHALMRDGGVDGLSIGFRVERARAERPTGLRRLEKLDLWEISIVTFPMLPGARVETVKHACSAARGDDPPDRRATVRLNPALRARRCLQDAGGCGPRGSDLCLVRESGDLS